MLISMRTYIALALPMLFFAACQSAPTEEQPTTETSDNVLLQEWTGPYGGVPAFDKMEIALMPEAMETAMATSSQALGQRPL